MSCQLPGDCLNEIFEYLDHDRKTLHSLLLVNRFYLTSSFLSTLFACLPKGSKDLLFKNRVFISTPTSKPPLFNYPSFCKVLSIDEICQIISIGLEKTPITIISKKDESYLVINEVIKIYRVSKIPNELKELISLQNNLKNLRLSASNEGDWTVIIPTLTKHSNTLTKLHLYSENNNNLPLSFISLFLNLQEIKLSGNLTNDFGKLHYITFPKLQYLSMSFNYINPEYGMKFLEINGKNLKKLSIVIYNGELNTLRTIFNSCQYLESIKIRCGEEYLSEKEILEIIATPMILMPIHHENQIEILKNNVVNVVGVGTILKIS
ncbi:hypothetical protein C1645_837271 [Glomus cerebriforme]|uniref:F-box domain-containing protein n=1 Tax=Glomus cerebriforme TaxID=658196 RepID=A0A397S5K0_9GLOM|nr:hypothetical protein C1645_837271 [Glomus cerebriforme]